MNYWSSLGLLRNDNNDCFQKAFLIVQGNGQLNKIPFKFCDIADDTITDVESTLPMSYDKRTKGIFVPNYQLPFVKNARVEFMDKTTMTVSSIVKVVDEKKALSDGQGIIGLNIYFGG